MKLRLKIALGETFGSARKRAMESILSLNFACESMALGILFTGKSGHAHVDFFAA